MLAKSLRFWLSFVTFTSDVYASVGFDMECESLVQVLLRTFDFMLHNPVLDALRIEEARA